MATWHVVAEIYFYYEAKFILELILLLTFTCSYLGLSCIYVW